MMQFSSRFINRSAVASSSRIVHHVNMGVHALASSARTGVSSRRNSKKGVCDASAPRRTTVTLSPESQEIVERFRSANGTSTSAAIDQIIQRSEPKPSRLKEVNGFLVLSAPPERRKDVRHITLEDIKRAEDEMDREYVERILHRNRAPAMRKRKVGASR